MSKLNKLNILLTLLLAHIDTADFLYVLLGFVLVAEMPESTRQYLISGLNEMIGARE